VAFKLGRYQREEMNSKEAKTVELAIHSLGFVNCALRDAKEVMKRLSKQALIVDRTDKFSKNGLEALNGSQKAIDDITASLKNLVNPPN
jgi:hypothetical protein